MLRVYVKVIRCWRVYLNSSEGRPSELSDCRRLQLALQVVVVAEAEVAVIPVQEPSGIKLKL